MRKPFESCIDNMWFINYVKKLRRLLAIVCMIFVSIGYAVSAPMENRIQEKITLNVNNESLDKVIEAIEENSDISIFYDRNEIDLSQKYTKHYQQETIKYVLEDLLKSSNKTYKLMENHVVIINKESSSRNSNNRKVSVEGTVVDETGLPIIGATVIVKGQTLGTATDLDGKYLLEGVAESDMLVFSYIGCTSVESSVGTQKVINVTLKSSLVAMDEVVVVGYGVQKKVNVTGSVASVKGDAIKDVPSPTITNTLAGRLPGVVITQRSGEPGNDNADIRIRGFENPLIIVDGVEADFSRLDPNDIENISILKDASAAIYGARAGNGVVLVTTKRGVNNEKTSVELNFSYGWQGSTVYPEYANAAQYMELVNDYAPGTYLDVDFKEFKDGTRTSTNWYDETFRKSAPIAKTNVNVKGGGEKISYFLSYGFLNQESVLRSGDTNYKQHNVRSNITAKISENLEATIDLSHRIELKSYPGYNMENIMTNVAFSNPMYPAYYPDKSYPVYNGFQMGPNYLSRRDVTGYNDSEFNNTSANFALQYKSTAIEGLSAKAFLNYSSWGVRSKSWKEDFSYFTYDPASGIYEEVVMTDVSNISLSESYDRGYKLTSNFFIGYNNTFGKHNVGALLLNEIITSDGDYLQAGRGDFTSSAVDQMFGSSVNVQTTGGWAWQDSRLSFVGRFNYAYDNRYLLEFTLREDASPRFSKNNRWGFFPSISAGWRVTEEQFMENVSFIDNLKLRLSYGQSGYDNIGNYNFLTGYVYGWSYVLDNEVVTSVTTKGLANPDATWEKMTMYNLGLDFSIYNRKLWGEADVFYRYRDDMLGTRAQSLPSTFGAILPMENINSQSSRGFEFLLGHDNNIGDFRYSFSANVSFARAKWDHYDEPVYPDEQSRIRYQQSGQWVNRYFGYKAMGLFTSQDEIDSWADQDGDLSNGINTALKPGDVKYYDLNHDGIINDLDKFAIGKSDIPETYYGFTANCGYKGLEFSMLWQGAARYNVAFSSEAQQPFYNNAMPLAMFMDRWTPENNDANATFPRTVDKGGSENNYRESTFWLQDGKYLRLKNISLMYNLPKKFVEKLRLENVRVTASGINLLTFTDIYPYDPETSGGGRGWDYPQQRTYMLGLNIGF